MFLNFIELNHFLQFILSLCTVLVSCAKLNNNYIPPRSALGAGGSGNFLATPFFSGASSSFASSSGSYRTAEGNAHIVSFNNDNDGTGSYSFK